MKIVAMADTHTFQDEFPEAIPDGDLLLHAGDLLRAGTLQELAPVAEWLQSLPHPEKIVVAGNHDRCFQEQPEEAKKLLGPGIHYLEDVSIKLHGLQIWGSPWTPFFNHWAFMLPRGPELGAKWRKIPSNVDILITHGPPQGIGDGGGYGHTGSETLRDETSRIQPLLHIFGHCHSGGGVWFHETTCFANVTTWECERPPTVFELDPTTRLLSVTQMPPGNLYP